jgi:hypothetical protein
MTLDEGVLHCTFAKYAVAFPKMSRPSFHLGASSATQTALPSARRSPACCVSVPLSGLAG